MQIDKARLEELKKWTEKWFAVWDAIVSDSATESNERAEAQCDLLSLIDNAMQDRPASDEVQKAIEWQQSLKQHHQREWEKTDTDWKMEPGAQEHHEAMMASFDMAIQALQKAGEAK